MCVSCAVALNGSFRPHEWSSRGFSSRATIAAASVWLGVIRSVNSESDGETSARAAPAGWNGQAGQAGEERCESGERDPPATRQ